MRFYSFSNMYLSSLQVALQGGHVIAELFVKYNIEYHQEKTETLYDWANNHKTIILLNGGYSKTLRNLIEFFDNTENPYPWTSFHESEEALGGALTNVGIILPEKIYIVSAMFKQYPVDLVNQRNPYGLIRDTGSLFIAPENKWNYNTTETIAWEFNKWEFDLLQKLNTFELAK